MIKEIDELMVHWGEQRRRHGLGAGIGSQMGSIMEWKGCAPRGTLGPRVISGGLGMDFLASEIESVIANFERSEGVKQKYAYLARARYVEEVPVREQMRQLGIAENADRTYRNWIQRMHRFTMDALQGRRNLIKKEASIEEIGLKI